MTNSQGNSYIYGSNELGYMNSTYSNGLTESPKLTTLFKRSRSFSTVRFFLFVCFFLSVIPLVTAQKKNADYRLHIRRANTPITIDGVADEQAWTETDVAKDFFMVLPEDTGKATQQSEIRGR